MSRTYAHMCKNDHVEIGYSQSDDDERCPLCRVFDAWDSDIAAAAHTYDNLRTAWIARRDELAAALVAVLSGLPKNPRGVYWVGELDALAILAKLDKGSAMSKWKCKECPKWGREKPNDAKPVHLCPYLQDIYGDSETKCKCCNDCQNDCTREI